LHAIPLIKERRESVLLTRVRSVACSENSSRCNESSDDETRGQRSAIRSPSGKRKVDVWSACICITKGRGIDSTRAPLAPARPRSASIRPALRNDRRKKRNARRPAERAPGQQGGQPMSQALRGLAQLFWRSVERSSAKGHRGKREGACVSGCNRRHAIMARPL
jgi:hypothetical protein